MIQEQSLLKVLDNSGAKTVKCIKILGGYKKKYAKIGDKLIVSVQQLRNKSKKTSKVKKKEIYKAIIIRTKNGFFKKNWKISFNYNAVVLIKNSNNPVGTRILGPVPKFFKFNRFKKFLSISNGSF